MLANYKPSIYVQCAIVLLAELTLSLHWAQAEEVVALPNTQPLTIEGDIASQLVDGVDRFLLRQIEAAADARVQHWNRDFGSADVYDKSIEPNRQRLAHQLGVRDDRVSFDGPELVGTMARPVSMVTATSAPATTRGRTMPRCRSCCRRSRSSRPKLRSRPPQAIVDRRADSGFRDRADGNPSLGRSRRCVQAGVEPRRRHNALGGDPGDALGDLWRVLLNGVADGLVVEIKRRIKADGPPAVEYLGSSTQHLPMPAAVDVVSFPIPNGMSDATRVSADGGDPRRAMLEQVAASLPPARLLLGHTSELRLRVKK